ncbi:hypothetical protein EFV37_16935 [Mesorhizobium loti]|uniref:Uncharacterized protein n=1 Tax=Mesorhizobium jarvisii TaxID=1777867 RepID=A0A6M7TG94_9HYPH|nr:hypothetical protein A9K72_30320 [Mesorhizobium loti]QKC63789.1 hypothetical protein EB229_16930 [Mesorhizobium jarvisii]BCH01077.1 hypothetical protein MesoLj131b_30760 [Mesorhizobium sp. 131-2-5]BCH08836.1 hypothetical protein MesoLj131c_30940 [Mesorhizobium sp. 131-3-5]QKD09701.1 hypothetical protein EFV37_16935 [Mesorhizobium loti]
MHQDKGQAFRDRDDLAYKAQDRKRNRRFSLGLHKHDRVTLLPRRADQCAQCTDKSPEVFVGTDFKEIQFLLDLAESRFLNYVSGMAARVENKPLKRRCLAEMSSNPAPKDADMRDVAEESLTRFGGIPGDARAIWINDLAFSRDRLTLKAISGKLLFQGQHSFVNDR